MTAAIDPQEIATDLARRDGEFAARARASHEDGIRVGNVIVGERARKDYGDLTSLKESIHKHGLLQPIVLLPDDHLLCGGRRLEACKQLNWESIPYVRSSTQGDAISRLQAERDENTCRKDMTPSELVAVGKMLEDLKRPEAEARMLAGTLGPNGPRVDSHSKRVEVAEVLGMTDSIYKRAKRVVAVATDPETPESVRLIAQAAMEEMDAGTIAISAAEERVKAAVNALKPHTEAGPEPTAIDPEPPPAAPKPPIPTPASKTGPRRKQIETLSSIATGLSGYLIALDEITELDSSVGKEEAARIKGDFRNAVTGIRRVNRLLEERTK